MVDRGSVWDARPRAWRWHFVRCGVTVYFGRGWTFHLSTEDGFQIERAEHRTLRLGVILAWRGAK